MPDELIRHFYRGYVDGDGHVGFPSGKARLELLATKPFLEEFQSWLYDTLGIAPTAIRFYRGMWAIQKCGNRQVPRIAHLLYSDCSWYLDRKYNAAVNILRIGLSGEPIRPKRTRARTERSEDAPLRSPRL